MRTTVAKIAIIIGNNSLPLRLSLLQGRGEIHIKTRTRLENRDIRYVRFRSVTPTPEPLKRVGFFKSETVVAPISVSFRKKSRSFRPFRAIRTRKSAVVRQLRLAENVRSETKCFVRPVDSETSWPAAKRVSFFIGRPLESKNTAVRRRSALDGARAGAKPKEDRTVASIRTRRIVSDGLREFYPFPLAVYYLSFRTAPTFGALAPNDGFPKNTCTHANVPNHRENNNKVTKAHFPPAAAAAAAVTRV